MRGVAKLYKRAVAAFGAVLQKQTTRSSIAFAGSLHGGRRVVVSLIPGESEAGELRYRLYQKRFAELVNLSADGVEALLPPEHEPWEYYGSANPDWQGFQGCFRSAEEIDSLAAALSQVGASELTRS